MKIYVYDSKTQNSELQVPSYLCVHSKAGGLHATAARERAHRFLLSFFPDLLNSPPSIPPFPSHTGRAMPSALKEEEARHQESKPQ